MTATQIEIQLIAAVVAVACALPGVFLVLRGMAFSLQRVGECDGVPRCDARVR